MQEINLFLIRLGIAFLGAVLVGAACYGIARRNGRDTVGWYLTSFFPALIGFLIVLLAFPEKVTWWLSGILVTLVAPGILLALPGVSTPGQTKPCEACRKMIGWKVETCPWCGSASEIPEWREGTPVKRPLRSCFLYLFLFTLLMLIFFGLIGYFCVPDEPREPGHASGLTRHGSEGKA